VVQQLDGYNIRVNRSNLLINNNEVKRVESSFIWAPKLADPGELYHNLSSVGIRRKILQRRAVHGNIFNKQDNEQSTHAIVMGTYSHIGCANHISISNRSQ
jgi:hypothetical protein